MADGVKILDSDNAVVEILSDEMTDSDLGLTGQKQYVGIMDGTPGSKNKAVVASDGSLQAVTHSGSTTAVDSMPAAIRTIDTIAITRAIDSLVLPGNPQGTLYTVKRAFANVAASQTDSSIVAAVASKSIYVIAFRLHCGATATTITFNSKPAGAGAAISELFALGANGGRAEGVNEFAHFKTVAGEGLTVTTGAGSTIGIGVTYIEFA